MKKMLLSSRILIAAGSLALIAVFFYPVWFIFLLAPQYPEGLTMNIWLNKITGQVDIINGLNHYIGMKHISAEMFPEFGFLVYIVGFFIALGLLISITGNRKFLSAYLFLTIAGGIAAIVDFYKWGYNYGHNLDPKAPIQVPGLYYQPPVIGHKTLLNFDAYSYPDTGGWIIVAVSSLFFIVWFFEWRRNRKKSTVSYPAYKKIISSTAAILLVTLSSCGANPEPFAYGKDNCDDCRMTIMDPKFGAEIITKKGRVYKFDDMHCVRNYIQKGKIQPAEIARVVFVDYKQEKNFIDSKSAFFVVSPEFKSPMGSNTAVFANKESADTRAKELNGELTDWDNFLKSSN